MKRIEFIAPVEAMRGNLSGSQDLNYGANDGRAYDQEVGKQTAANNYDPRFVGAKRSRDGLKYFQVRTKNTIGLTQKSKAAMALLAGSAACFLAASKNVAILTRLQVAFDAAKESDASLTWRKWLQGIMYEMLALKLNSITISSSVGDVVIKNPWLAIDGAGTNLDISHDVLIKFWTVLSVDGITFEVNGKKGIGWLDNGFDSIVGTPINVLNLKIQASTGYVQTSLDEYLTRSDGSYVIDADIISPNEVFGTTTTAPEP